MTFCKCLKTWYFADFKLRVLDDQTGKVSLSWRLWHLSQAGWCRVFYSLLERFQVYLHVGLDSGTLPLTALWWPLCTNSFGELLSMSRFCLSCLIDDHILTSAVQILLRIPKYKNQVSWGLISWCEDRSDTFGVYQSRSSCGKETATSEGSVWWNI